MKKSIKTILILMCIISLFMLSGCSSSNFKKLKSEEYKKYGLSGKIIDKMKVPGSTYLVSQWVDGDFLYVEKTVPDKYYFTLQKITNEGMFIMADIEVSAQIFEEYEVSAWYEK